MDGSGGFTPGRFARLVKPHLGPKAVGPSDLPPWEAVKIIGKLGRQARWQDALALFWLHRNMDYDTRVWNALISACARGQQSWQAAVGLLECLEGDPYCDADLFSFSSSSESSKRWPRQYSRCCK